MSIVKITIKLNQKNPARVKLKVNITPLGPKRTETGNINQSPSFEPQENIPAGIPEEQKPIQDNPQNLWYRISSWLNLYNLKHHKNLSKPE